jgi:hypothetical protein
MDSWSLVYKVDADKTCPEEITVCWEKTERLSNKMASNSVKFFIMLIWDNVMCFPYGKDSI